MHKLFIIFIIGVLIPLQTNASLLLVKNGKPQYSIVVSANPLQEDFRAADYLQRYIAKISGATLPIITDNSEPTEKEIIIGETKRIDSRILREDSPIIDDEFILQTRDKKLFIYGKKKGLFYGVVSFLENYLGCRKYSPGFEYTPKMTSIEIPDINKHEKPMNTYRVVYGNFTADKDYKDWHRLNEIDDVFGEGYYSHTFWKLVPANQYFEKHPEYYSLINGVRSPKQLCLSNPEVLNIAIKTLQEEIQRQPTRKVWSVSQNDNRNYCTCEQCSKIIKEEGSPSGPIIRFVNKIAERFPNLTISTLAYTYSRTPPKLTKPAKNVQIMLCTAELSRNLPIEVDPNSAGFVADLKGWRTLSDNLYLWDYVVNFSNNISPFPNLRTLQSNIQFFVKNGIKEQFQQSNAETGFEFAELKSYVLSRLLWNPYVKTDSIFNEFFRGYYGRAASWIRDYAYQLERESLRNKESLNIYASPSWYSNSFLSEKNIKFYKSCFDSAFNAVKGDSIMTAHVAIAYLPLQYAILEIGKTDLFGPRGWFQNVNGQTTLRFNIKEELDNFYYFCKKYKIKTLNEAGLTPQDYYMANIRFLVPQINQNLAYKKKVVAIPEPSQEYSIGDLSLLTNGFYGSSTLNNQWISWHGTDFDLLLDLEKVEHPREICISSLNLPSNWAFYPNKISCFVSEDGVDYRSIGQVEIDNSEKINEITHNFCFSTPPGKVRYIKFKLDCTKRLPNWVVMDGEKSWTFIDEIVVKP
jgi:hypothetical protein